jgi:murein DD-endopeptidase MepM/ murein hydrolase activator NlpD
VRIGQRVKRGDEIALVGNTGISTSPHLHYEVEVWGRTVDPRKYIFPETIVD